MQDLAYKGHKDKAVNAPAIAITTHADNGAVTASSDDEDDEQSNVLTPTASGSRHPMSIDSAVTHVETNKTPVASSRVRPTPLKRLSGLPKGLKLNLRKGSNRSHVPTEPGAPPLGYLCIRVLAARNLTSKDRNGKSDPWLALRLGDARAESEVVKASLNPVWGQLEGVSKSALTPDGTADKEAFLVAPVWEDTLHLCRAEVVAWDRDTFTKDEYLGEISLGLEDWTNIFRHDLPVAWDTAENQPFWRIITSSKSKSKVSGELLLKIGFLAAPTADDSPTLEKVASDRSRKSSHPPTTGSNDMSIATKIMLLASRTTLGKYASTHRLTPEETTTIQHAIRDRIADLGQTPDLSDNATGGTASENTGKQRGWQRLRRKRRPTMQERVFAAPPSEGVGTLRLDQSTHGSLSNDLTSGEIFSGYSSESSSPSDAEDDYDTDAGILIRDDASATSDASSPAEGNDVDDAAEYFDLALGMQDAPKNQEQSAMPQAHDHRKSDAAAGYASMPSTPGDVSSKKKKSAFPNLFKRTSSSRSVDAAGHASGTKLDLTPYDTDSGSAAPSEPPSGATTPNAYRRRKFTRRKVYLGADDSADVGAVHLDAAKQKKKRKAPKTGRRRKTSQPSTIGHGGYSISTGAAQDDTLGIVFIEVKGANNLPRWRNMTRTGWDMDPFCIVSFGKKVFRTRVIRHSRNPVWDERLFFHVQRHEQAYQMLFTLFDWDKISSNDFVGEVPLLLSELNDKAPKPDPTTGIFAASHEGKVIGDELHNYTLTLGSKSAELEDTAKEATTITFRAKFTPYSALRQRFWRTYLRQYDTDDSGSWSYVELYSLLDSLGATLTRVTIDSFFTRFGKSPEDTLTVDEAIICLEDELTKPRSEKRAVESSASDYSGSRSGINTPAREQSPSPFGLSDNAGLGGGITFTGEPLTGEPAEGVPPKDTAVPRQNTLAAHSASGGNTRASSASSLGLAFTPASRKSSQSSSNSATDAHASADNGPGTENHELERVINIKTCPLCHKKLSKKAEVDMVSHLAVCASQDWSSLDSLTVANFVSTSQAGRKWFTKLVTKVSHGSYKLGADSANILVQDRITGQLQEEKMQVYVRLGIRLWYRAAGSSSRMEANRIKKLLRSMTFKQGIKFDAPESKAEIPRFIAYHRLNMKEVLDPIDSFPNFNSFFYRKLKPDARPVTDPDDPRTLVSGSDCRMTAFQTITDATNIWIKGRTFSIKRLLGEDFKDEASKYEGGSLCIFRLAPQDYHRYHSPVDGTIGKMSAIPGEYYTVNPIAIRSALDVYAENARVIVPMDSEAFGRVHNVCIGAMMVGSIKFTKEAGDHVKRGEEYGYFAFGGSTIVCLFEPDTVRFDDDILQNSAACIETLVRVGMRIGRSVRK